MPKLRKKSSVLTYNDDAVYKAIENQRNLNAKGRRSKQQDTAAGHYPFVNNIDNIPEVVYADDGREFFPCYFCCYAFAFKPHQMAHMQQCNFKEPQKILPNLPPTLTVKKEKKPSVMPSGNFMQFQPKNKLVIQNNKLVIQKNKLVMQRSKQCESLIPKTSCSYKVQKRTMINSVNALRKRKAELAAFQMKSKQLQTNPKAMVQNLKQFNRVKKNSARKTFKKPPVIHFPKIKVEPFFAGDAETNNHSIQDEQVFNGGEQVTNASENPEGFKQHKQEINLLPKILISPDKLKEYDEMYKQSDLSKCTICYRPVTKVRWIRHLQTHTASRDYLCKICNRRFGRKDNRDAHEKLHEKSPDSLEMINLK